MIKVKEMFDDLDEDASGQLDREEVKNLALRLGKTMSETDVDIAMHEMDTDRSGEVDFQEFYKWWDRGTGSARGAIAAAEDLARREAESEAAAQKAMWAPQKPVETTYRKKVGEDVLVARNEVKRMQLSSGGGAPRMRRCTVEQIFGMTGG
jgi:hypothetical protein